MVVPQGADIDNFSTEDSGLKSQFLGQVKSVVVLADHMHNKDQHLCVREVI